MGHAHDKWAESIWVKVCNMNFSVCTSCWRSLPPRPAKLEGRAAISQPGLSSWPLRPPSLLVAFCCSVHSELLRPLTPRPTLVSTAEPLRPDPCADPAFSLLLEPAPTWRQRAPPLRERFPDAVCPQPLSHPGPWVNWPLWWRPNHPLLSRLSSAP